LELHKLAQFAEDDLIESNDQSIMITEIGYQFTNIVCKAFKKYYDREVIAKDLGALTPQEGALSN